MPHAQLLLRLIMNVVTQPFTVALYLASLLFSGAVAALFLQLFMRYARNLGEVSLNLSERLALLPKLNRLALSRGATGMMVITGTIIGVGVLGLIYLNEWSVENIMFGLIISGIVAILLIPVFLVNYAVFRYFLLKHGHFGFTERSR